MKEHKRNNEADSEHLADNNKTPAEHESEKIVLDKEEFIQLKNAASERDDIKDKFLRMAAEVENFKKRVSKEQEQFLQFSNERVFMQLIPIIDDFDRANDAAKQHEHGEVFIKGVEMILNQLHKLLKDNGVEKIKTIGENFDPHIHEAVTTVKTEEHEDGTITEEVSPGYLLNGKLLRAAKVKVAKNEQVC